MHELVGRQVLPPPLPPEVVPLLSEAELELIEVEERIVKLHDELAVLEEQYCVNCERDQEKMIMENSIAKRKLWIVAQERLKLELLQEIQA